MHQLHDTASPTDATNAARRETLANLTLLRKLLVNGPAQWSKHMPSITATGDHWSEVPLAMAASSGVFAELRLQGNVVYLGDGPLAGRTGELEQMFGTGAATDLFALRGLDEAPHLTDRQLALARVDLQVARVSAECVCAERQPR